MDLSVHPDILEILRKQVLPHVIKVQGFNIPSPAELWIDGCCHHQNGVAMLNIGDLGFLNAEYFAYDNLGSHWYPSRAADVRLKLTHTQTEILSQLVRANPKTRMIFGGVEMPPVEAYNCHINGWIGGSTATAMPAARITLIDLPDLHLPHSQEWAPEDDRGYFTMRGILFSNAILKLNAGDWSIDLIEANSNLTTDAGKLYHTTLTRRDGSPFTLDDGSILDALIDFLSFQAGRWITVPTIVCDPVDPNVWVIERARIGKLIPTTTRSGHTGPTATDIRIWPSLFEEFWKQYTDQSSHEHLKNTVHHYVEANQLLSDGYIGQALVAARSTLQALTRWWNGYKITHQFIESEKDNQPSFRQLLNEAVQKADLGKDSKLVIDEAALEDAIKTTARWRNDIDHGRGAKIEGHGQTVVDCQLHHHNLARLLILAKLGNRDRDARGHLTGPNFTQRPVL